MNLQTLPLDQVDSGMSLGLDVRDLYGAVLLVAGCVLNDAMIASLRRRGVEQISVATPASACTDAELATLREAQRVRLAHLFRHAGEAAADRALFEMVLDYRMERIECPQ